MTARRRKGETIALPALLLKAASLIETEADVILRSYSLRNRWTDPAEKAMYDEYTATARTLRRAAGYWRQNPLGGPAVIFSAIVERLQCGEPWADVLRDYNVQVNGRPRLKR